RAAGLAGPAKALLCISFFDWRTRVSQRVTSVVDAAQVVDRINEDTNVLGIGELRDAVPQIEYVTGSFTVRGQDSLCFTAYALWRTEQNCGIEIALERYAFADPRARRGNVRRPVEPHRVGAARCDVFEPGAAALGKDDPRYR